VLVQTGITYCGACITGWLDRGGAICPATGQVLSSKATAPNHLVKGLLEQLAATGPSTVAGLEDTAEREQQRQQLERHERYHQQQRDAVAALVARLAPGTPPGKRRAAGESPPMPRRPCPRSLRAGSSAHWPFHTAPSCLACLPACLRPALTELPACLPAACSHRAGDPGG
jgi:hypothetical protein